MSLRTTPPPRVPRDLRPSPTLSVVETARLLGISPGECYAWLKAGAIPATRKSGGRYWCILRADVERLLGAGSTATPAATPLPPDLLAVLTTLLSGGEIPLEVTIRLRQTSTSRARISFPS